MTKKKGKDTGKTKKTKTDKKPGDGIKKQCGAQKEELRDKLKREIQWFNAKAHRDQSQHMGRMAERFAKESGLDLTKVKDTFERLYDRRRRFARKYGEQIRKQLLLDIKRKRKLKIDKLKNQQKELAGIRDKIKGNPRIFMDTPIDHSRRIEIDIEDYEGCGGGPLVEDVNGSCDFELLVPGMNYFSPYAHADNDGMQHLHHSAIVHVRLVFEHPAPERGVFLGDRIWVPVYGEGIFISSRGKEADWPDCMLLGDDGLRRETASITMEVEINQAGTHSHLHRYYSLSRRSGPRDTVEVIEIDPFSASESVDFYFRGADRGGGNITAEVILRIAVTSYYRDEMIELDFRDPSYMLLNGLIFSGKIIE